MTPVLPKLHFRLQPGLYAGLFPARSTLRSSPLLRLAIPSASPRQPKLIASHSSVHPPACPPSTRLIPLNGATRRTLDGCSRMQHPPAISLCHLRPVRLFFPIWPLMRCPTSVDNLYSAGCDPGLPPKGYPPTPYCARKALTSNIFHPNVGPVVHIHQEAPCSVSLVSSALSSAAAITTILTITTTAAATRPPRRRPRRPRLLRPPSPPSPNLLDPRHTLNTGYLPRLCPSHDLTRQTRMAARSKYL